MQYLYVELKKTIVMFPRMLFQAILLMALISVIAFCGVKGMEAEPLAVGADIGVAAREENTMTRMALSYIENMESVSQIYRFVRVSEEEGFVMLDRREIAALVILPEQLVEGIVNGRNPAVDIIFPKNARLEAMLFRELTESGADLLRIAQAQIYGAIDTTEEYGLTDRLTVMEAEIDGYNLAFALDRLAIFDEKTVSATGRMSVWQYYAASGIILFLLLAGMAVYPVMQREPDALSRQLKRQGTGMVWQCFCKWLCGLVCMGMICGAMWLALRLAGIVKPEWAGEILSVLMTGRKHYTALACVGVILLVTVTATTLIYMVYSLAGGRTGSILLIFLLTVIMVYLSGGFVPSVFMPQAVQTVGDRLPTAYMIRAVGGLFAGYGDGVLGRCMAGMSAYTAAFGAAAYMLRKR